jgi:hypothetical protein
LIQPFHGNRSDPDTQLRGKLSGSGKM